MLLPALETMEPRDVVLRASPGAYAVGYEVLEAEVRQVIARVARGTMR